MWETLLQEVEVDSAVVADIANCLNRQVSRPMIDGTFHRKLEARKIFQHREQLENALEKASQQLDKVRAVLYVYYQFEKKKQKKKTVSRKPRNLQVILSRSLHSGFLIFTVRTDGV